MSPDGMRTEADFIRADFTYESEMGFTHRELLNSLPAAVKPFHIEKQSDLAYQLRRADEGGAGQRIVLTIKPETSRSIAAITLPVTAVKLEFFGFSEALFESFMQRYKRYLHKGGG